MQRAPMSSPMGVTTAARRTAAGVTAILVVALALVAVSAAGAAAMGVDRAEMRAAARDASLRAPLPPPPPYTSMLLQIEEQIKNAEQAAAAGKDATNTAAATKATAKATAQTESKAAFRAGQRINSVAGAAVGAAVGGSAGSVSDAASRMRAKLRLKSAAHARARSGDPFPDQEFTYKDVSSPPDWLVPEESEPAGPTTKPPPVPQMIPPPPPVPFPTYNYHDPNSAGPFSQYAPGVQGWGYDGGYAGPYDGYSLYGHQANPAQARGWGMPGIPRTAAQIAAATASSQYHPWGAPPPLYALGNPPPDGAASWVPLGAFLKPGTLEGGAGEDE